MAKDTKESIASEKLEKNKEDEAAKKITEVEETETITIADEAEDANETEKNERLEDTQDAKENPESENIQEAEENKDSEDAQAIETVEIAEIEKATEPEVDVDDLINEIMSDIPAIPPSGDEATVSPLEETTTVETDSSDKDSTEEDVVVINDLDEEHAKPDGTNVNVETATVTEIETINTTTPDSDQSKTISESPVTNKTTPIKQKKSKAPLIVFLCLLLAAIGGLIAWLIIRSTPEAQVSDAISNFLTTKQFSMTGTVNLKFDQSTNPDIRSVKLDIGASSTNIPFSTSTTLSITTQDNSIFKLDLGQVISHEGTLYLKLSGLQKAIDNAKVPDEVQSYLDYFSDVIKMADGQWWMISVTDLLDQLEFDTSYGEAYQCVITQVADNDGSELANLYQKYPFIDVEGYTGTTLQPVNNGTIFSISIDRPKLTSFQNELPNTSYQKSLKKCLDKLPDGSTNSTSTQINDLIDDLGNLPPAYIEVAGFDHHLARFYYDYSSDDLGSLNLDLRFNFPNSVSVDMPTDARDVSELVKRIVDDTQYLLYDVYYPTYQDCTSNANTTDCIVYQ